MSKNELGLSERMLGLPGQRLSMILLGLLGGAAGGTVVFFDTGQVFMAVGYGVVIALFVVIGWNLSRNAHARDGHRAGSIRQQLPLREASAGTKALAILGLLLAFPGLWLMRDEQSVIGIPLLMVAFVPMFLVLSLIHISEPTRLAFKP